MISEVKSFFKAINFKRVIGDEAISNYVYKNVECFTARQLFAYMNEMAEESQKNLEVLRKKFYDLKNSGLNTSLIITSAFYYDYFEKLLEYLYQNIDEIDGRVLVVGCDCGIEACFLKVVKPELDVVGIDINSNAIAISNELAKKLNLDVQFENKPLSHIVDKYDAVISFRTAHENVDLSKEGYYHFARFDEKQSYYCEQFDAYANEIVSVLDEYGILISMERFYGISLLSWMTAFEEKGVQTLSIDKISDTKETYDIILAQKYNHGINAFEEWKSFELKDFNPSASEYKGLEAEYFLSCAAGDLIDGYYLIKDCSKLVSMAIYKHKNDETAILYSLINNETHYVGVYDVSMLEQLLQHIDVEIHKLKNESNAVIEKIK